VGQRVAVEAGGDQLRRRRVGEQVAGQLLDRETVVGHVVVVGLDDPVAPAPDGAVGVVGVALAVGVAGQVEPDLGPAFAVGRVGQRPVDVALVGVGGGVVDEAVRLLDARGQPGQVEGRPTGQGVAVGGRGGAQPFLLQPGQDEVVDGVDGPVRVADLGDGRA